jgi:hypothetical protein
MDFLLTILDNDPGWLLEVVVVSIRNILPGLNGMSCWKALLMAHNHPSMSSVSTAKKPDFEPVAHPQLLLGYFIAQRVI